MRHHPPPLLSVQDDPDQPLLPFGGLGLDMAEVQRKASVLCLQAVPKPEAALTQTGDAPTPPLYGYGLLLRLGRETRGR